MLVKSNFNYLSFIDLFTEFCLHFYFKFTKQNIVCSSIILPCLTIWTDVSGQWWVAFQRPYHQSNTPILAKPFSTWFHLWFLNPSYKVPFYRNQNTNFCYHFFLHRKHEIIIPFLYPCRLLFRTQLYHFLPFLNLFHGRKNCRLIMQ